jgi:uncharacterized protein (TIGR03067 family)
MLTGIICLLTIASPCLGANQPTKAGAKEGVAELQGAWKLVSVELHGKVIDFTDKQPRLVIKGNKVQHVGQEIAVLSADPAATPKIIDLSFLSPKKVLEGIYAVEKDTLKICVNTQIDGVKERPDGFSTKDKEPWRVLVFERTKEDAPDNPNGFAGLALGFDKDRKAVVVASVIDGSPAKKAGLLKDDAILKVGGKDITDVLGAVDAVRQTKPGTALVFRIVRDGKESDVTVTVGVAPFTMQAFLD